MPQKPSFELRPHVVAAIILLAGLLATWVAYAPGLGGSLQFDDYNNLGGLASVQDSESAFQFVISGQAGPLGRPLALASFVPQAYAWPSAPDVFLRTNVLIHLLNGTLVAWFLYLLGCARGQSERQASLIATGAASIWMLLPLLASSSLFIVQRMTTLATLFMLCGVVGYMYARRASNKHPTLAILGMTLALSAGAILGAFTKENGALLFVFVLAVETTLLKRPLNIHKSLWSSWFTLFLLAPLIALVIYLASILPYPEAIVLKRNFTGFERLLTQAEILWKYLYHAFLPGVPSLGPFHDDHLVRRNPSDIAVLLSVGGWVAVVAAAIIFRRRAPLFSFAVTWYLLGHLLESTTVSLELYFEHRNYLPLLGPIYALLASLTELKRAWLAPAAIAMALYAVVLGGILFSTTSLWGSPLVSAEMWHIYKPASLRATQHLAGILQRQGDPFTARRILGRHIEENPGAYGAQLQVLVISCQLGTEENHSETVRLLARKLPDADFTPAVSATFHQLYELVSEQRCPGMDLSDVYSLGQSLLANPRFSAPIFRHNIHVILARTAIDAKDFSLTMAHMEEALSQHHNTETLLLTIGILNSGGRDDISWKLLTDAKKRQPPRHPLRALQWKQQLTEIESVLLASSQFRQPES